MHACMMHACMCVRICVHTCTYTYACTTSYLPTPHPSRRPWNQGGLADAHCLLSEVCEAKVNLHASFRLWNWDQRTSEGWSEAAPKTIGNLPTSMGPVGALRRLDNPTLEGAPHFFRVFVGPSAADWLDPKCLSLKQLRCKYEDPIRTLFFLRRVDKSHVYTQTGRTSIRILQEFLFNPSKGGPPRHAPLGSPLRRCRSPSSYATFSTCSTPPQVYSIPVPQA